MIILKELILIVPSINKYIPSGLWTMQTKAD